jgi:hypothetical protein
MNKTRRNRQRRAVAKKREADLFQKAIAAQFELAARELDIYAKHAEPVVFKKIPKE